MNNLSGAQVHVVGRVDNLQGLREADRRQVHEAMFRSRSEHGSDPCTKRQAAAHEAGHVVVGFTFGQRLTSVRIGAIATPEGTVWTGETRMSLPGRLPELKTDAAQDPIYAFRCAVVAMAGICGEIVAGLDHPTSSVDERIMAAVMCTDIAKVWAMDPERVIQMALILCERALTENKVAFEVIQGQLFNRRRLTRHTVEGVLARAKRFDLEEAAAAAFHKSLEPALPAPFAAFSPRTPLSSAARSWPARALADGEAAA